MSTNTKWVLDPAHCELTFKVKHLMISNVKGSFRKFSAEIDGEDFTKARIEANIDASSIDTNNADRDTHLKSPDFFDAAQFPEIHFTGTSFTKKSGDEYELRGMLTMKGESKEVVLDVEYGGSGKDPWGNEKAGFSVNGRINRKDWGLHWNAALETGGVMVSDEVKVFAELQFIKQSGNS